MKNIYYSESTIKLFETIIDELNMGWKNMEIDGSEIVAELVNTGRFTFNEALQMVEQMDREGLIYERRRGIYCKT